MAFWLLVTRPLSNVSKKYYSATHQLRYPPTANSKGGIDKDNGDNALVYYSKPLPSWEGYFGATYKLLHYLQHVKANYTSLLSQVPRNSKTRDHFFQALYFGMIDKALRITHLAPDCKQ